MKFIYILFILFGSNVALSTETGTISINHTKLNSTLSSVKPILLPESIKIVKANAVFSFGQIRYILVDFRLPYKDPSDHCGRIKSVFANGYSRLQQFHNIKGKEFKLLKEGNWCSGSTAQSENIVEFQEEIHPVETLENPSNKFGLTNILRFSGQKTYELELKLNDQELERLMIDLKGSAHGESEISLEINSVSQIN